MRFQVKIRDEIIGFSELEGGDPPMGVANGRFFPTAAYSSIQPHCIQHRDSWVPIPELTVCVPGDISIECSGGVQIVDLSSALGEAGIAIFLNGVPYPRYQELFPHHVEVYRKQFS